MSGEPLLEFRGVAFAYPGGAPVLSDCNLAVADGELLGIVGPNGTGKSTLLRLATRALAPRAGSVMLRGRELGGWDRREIARTIAVVPQGETSAFGFTVEEIVLMGRSPHLRGVLGLESDSDRAIARTALEQVGMESFARRPAASLSGGERQLVLIARALAQQTRLLLLDEPTASLDPAHQLQIARLILRTSRECGQTVVVVLHDLNLAARLCTRIAVLHGGRVAALGSPAEVLDPEFLGEVYGAQLWRTAGPDGAPLVGMTP